MIPFILMKMRFALQLKIRISSVGSLNWLTVEPREIIIIRNPTRFWKFIAPQIFFFEKKIFSRIFMHAASTAVCSLWAYFVHFYSIKREFDTYLQTSPEMRENEIFEKVEKIWKVSV